MAEDDPTPPPSHRHPFPCSSQRANVDGPTCEYFDLQEMAIEETHSDEWHSLRRIDRYAAEIAIPADGPFVHVKERYASIRQERAATTTPREAHGLDQTRGKR